MNRGFYGVLRAVIGIIFIAILLRFLGITWADVHTFLNNCAQTWKEVLNLLHGVAAS